ncbi:GTP-binding protein [Streptomyces sp. NPDC052040]
MPTGDDRKASGAAALIGHLNGKALVVTSPGGDAPTPASLAEALPSSTAHAWQARLEPVLAPRSPRVARHGVESVLWRARRPLHPGRLADALDAVMHGVVRGLGHLWLCSSPDAVVSWHSAGAYLELREADRWLEAHDTIAAARYEETVIGAEGWADSLGLNRPLDAAVSTT